MNSLKDNQHSRRYRIGGRPPIQGEKSGVIAWQSEKIPHQDEELTVCDTISKYVASSTLHGLKYIGDRSLTVFERLFFGLSFLVVVILSGQFISNIYAKWEASPIIVGLDPILSSVSEIPFPAVTVCNMNQADSNVVSKIVRGSIDDMFLESVCFRDVDRNRSSFSDFVGLWSNFKKFLMTVSQPCKNLIVQCEIAEHPIPCQLLFDTILTDDGLCCTFNNVHQKFMFMKDVEDFDDSTSQRWTKPVNWTPEGGYPKDVGKHFYPMVAAGAGSHLGLSLTLDAQVDNYYCSSTSSYGFKVLLHNPTETPKISDFGLPVNPGMETRIAIEPRVSKASTLIRKTPILQRQCVFANEGNLTYFRTYTRKNCEMECESRLIASACNCVVFFMPRLSDDVKVCSQKDSDCYNPVRQAIELANNASFSCFCLPGCFEVTFAGKMASTNFADGEVISHEHLLDRGETYMKKNLALVHIFYATSTFSSYTKEELIGFTEFLSNTGGLLGLFMGFSVFSLIEICYFVTLRPFCIIRQRNKYNKARYPDKKLKESMVVILGNSVQTKKSGSMAKIVRGSITTIKNQFRKVGEMIYREPETPIFPYTH